MITHSGPCEMIANDRIFGEDLAKALPAFLNKMPGDAVIGYSPAPGARRVFKSAGTAAHRRSLWRRCRRGRGGVFRMEPASR